MALRRDSNCATDAQRQLRKRFWCRLQKFAPSRSRAAVMKVKIRVPLAAWVAARNIERNCTRPDLFFLPLQHHSEIPIRWEIPTHGRNEPASGRYPGRRSMKSNCVLVVLLVPLRSPATRRRRSSRVRSGAAHNRRSPSTRTSRSTRSTSCCSRRSPCPCSRGGARQGERRGEGRGGGEGAAEQAAEVGPRPRHRAEEALEADGLGAADPGDAQGAKPRLQRTDRGAGQDGGGGAAARGGGGAGGARARARRRPEEVGAAPRRRCAAQGAVAVDGRQADHGSGGRQPGGLGGGDGRGARRVARHRPGQREAERQVEAVLQALEAQSVVEFLRQSVEEEEEV